MNQHRLPQRQLGSTGMNVSTMSLGTVKFGRSAGVKYPTAAALPSDAEAAALLQAARELGINLLDTAPAYGHSEERLGQLLAGQRHQWLLCTKVGEEFDGETSSYDFTPEHCRFSIERSLRRLQTDVLDIVLIHSNGADLEILNDFGTLEALQDMKQQGLIRAAGMSHKTVAGARQALAGGADVLMATLNPAHTEEAPIIAEAAAAGCGVLIKKALDSGHGQIADLTYVAAQPGVHSIVVGTTSPGHLRDNARAIAEAG